MCSEAVVERLLSICSFTYLEITRSSYFRNKRVLEISFIFSSYIGQIKGFSCLVAYPVLPSWLVAELGLEYSPHVPDLCSLYYKLPLILLTSLFWVLLLHHFYFKPDVFTWMVSLVGILWFQCNKKSNSANIKIVFIVEWMKM